MIDVLIIGGALTGSCRPGAGRIALARTPVLVGARSTVADPAAAANQPATGAPRRSPRRRGACSRRSACGSGRRRCAADPRDGGHRFKLHGPDARPVFLSFGERGPSRASRSPIWSRTVIAGRCASRPRRAQIGAEIASSTGRGDGFQPWPGQARGPRRAGGWHHCGPTARRRRWRAIRSARARRHSAASAGTTASPAS